jgi:hypothetical protein
VLDHGGGERPVGRRRHVGQQQPDLGAEHAHQQEEVLVDGHQAQRPAVTRVAAQLHGELVHVRGLLGLELLELPETLLAVGDQDEVHTFGVRLELLRHVTLLHPAPVRSLTSMVTGPWASHHHSHAPWAATRLAAMRTHVADHPLIAHKLTTLRDERTDSPTFRRLADELVTLLAYEATRDVRVDPVTSRPRSPGPAA